MSTFGREFAKAEELDPKFHRWLIDVSRERQEATYSIDPEIAGEPAPILITRPDEFVAGARAYLARP